MGDVISTDAVALFAFRVGAAAQRNDKAAAFAAVESLFDVEAPAGVMSDDETVLGLHDVGLNMSTCKRLQALGIQTLGQLRKIKKGELLTMHGRPDIVNQIVEVVRLVTR